MYQHFPSQWVPSLLGLIVNQSMSAALLSSMYLMSAWSSWRMVIELGRVGGGEDVNLDQFGL